MIGIVGYGRFGQLAARYLARNCAVVVCDRKPVPASGLPAGLRAGSLAETCRQPYVIPAVPISAFREVLQAMVPLLKPGTVVVDVCSVKELPVEWMREILPPSASILGTHPMFGPDSAANGLEGMKIALCPVRIEPEVCDRIADYLTRAGLVVIRTTPEEHDRQIAVSLALTHFIGRSLSAFGAQPLSIDTEGYKRLLHILGVVQHDTWQLFRDMHRYNRYAAQAREDFIRAVQQTDEALKT